MSNEYPYLVQGGSSTGNTVLPPISSDGPISFDPTKISVIYITACGGGGGGGSGNRIQGWDDYGGGGGGAATTIIDWPVYLPQFAPNDGPNVTFNIVIGIGGTGGVGSTGGDGQNGTDGTPTTISYNGKVFITMGYGLLGERGRENFKNYNDTTKPYDTGGRNQSGFDGHQTDLYAKNIVVGSYGENTNPNYQNGTSTSGKWFPNLTLVYPEGMLRSTWLGLHGDNAAGGGRGGRGGFSFFGPGGDPGNKNLDPVQSPSDLNTMFYGAGGGGSGGIDSSGYGSNSSGMNGGNGGNGIVIIKY